jgi:hypothetical protein
MCEYSEMLVAWLDRELREDQMTEVQRHTRDCLECRTQVDRYARVSRTVEDYCDTVMANKVQQRRPQWVPALALAAAVVLSVILTTVLLRPRSKALQPLPPAVAAETPVIPPVTHAAPKTNRLRRSAFPAQAKKATWLPTQPAIEIAIPAESILPPGAVPDGVNFTADVSFGPDGSAAQIRFEPQLVAFERKGIQP